MKGNIKPIFITMLIILGIAFIWYEVRPARIRASCNEKVLNDELYSTSKAERELLGGDMNKINKMEREKTDFWYKDCLRDNGLKE